jgi:CRP-like cAMP-binding protein
MNESDLISLLKSNPDFARVSERSLGELIRAGEIQSLKADAIIIREREAGQPFWMLIEGTLEALVEGDVVNHLSTAGEVVGQISAVSFTPATATVRMASDGSCLSVSHKALHEVMEKNPDLAEALLRSMAKYLGRR